MFNFTGIRISNRLDDYRKHFDEVSYNPEGDYGEWEMTAFCNVTDIDFAKNQLVFLLQDSEEYEYSICVDSFEHLEDNQTEDDDWFPCFQIFEGDLHGFGNEPWSSFTEIHKYLLNLKLNNVPEEEREEAIEQYVEKIKESPADLLTTKVNQSQVHDIDLELSVESGAGGLIRALMVTTSCRGRAAKELIEQYGGVLEISNIDKPENSWQIIQFSNESFTSGGVLEFIRNIRTDYELNRIVKKVR